MRELLSREPQRYGLAAIAQRRKITATRDEINELTEESG